MDKVESFILYKEAQLLKKWLEIDPKRTLFLAQKIGCYSTVTIRQWVYRNRIASKKRAKVMKIIGGK